MSAEEQVLSQPTAPPPEVPPVETTTAPAPSAPPKPEDRREVIKHALENPTQRGQHAKLQPRDQGKFAGPPQAKPEVPVAPVPNRPEMPKSLKKELEAHWNTAHPELAAAIHQRELDYEKGVTPLKEKARLADEISNEFRPYEMLLRAQNATPVTAIRSLLQTSAVFHTGSPVQKVQAVAQLMRQFGVPLEHVQQVLSGNAPPQQALDPHYEQLSQQVQQLTQQQQQANEARALAEIQAFAADPAHKHFEAVAERMQVLLQYPEVLGPEAATATERGKLQLAYDMAIRQNPALFQQVLAEQQAAERAKQQVTQARQAAVQVKGAPASGPAPSVDPKDRRAFIAQQVRALR